MDYLDTILDEFGKVSKKPEAFLSVDEANAKQIKGLLKKSYDFTKTEESDKIKSQALPELIVKDFDLEQIWQQMELQNDGFLTRSLRNVSKLVVSKDKLLFSQLKSQIQDEATDEEEQNAEQASDESSDDDDEAPLQLDEEDDELSLNSDDLEEDNNAIDKKKPKSKTSAVDDKFFKLDEMEAFLNSEEKKMNDKEPDSGNDTESDEDEEMEDDDEMDLFKDDSDDMESNEKERGQKKNPKYKDFFGIDNDDRPKAKAPRNKFLEQQEEKDDKEEKEEEEVQGGNEISNVKSSLELREERLKRKINYIEEAAVGEKPWQLKGEITADSRPQNSLLEEIVEFDLTTRPAPVITEQTSMILEDVIRLRIKDKVFDSVVRKEKPVESLLEYKKKLVLNQEKSKESLAQIYEKEYLQQKEALDPAATEKEEEEPQLHKDIKKMMHSVFSKLDSLTNFYFTPKLAAPDLKIISNIPAINMEEVAPVATSDAAMLAPQEVKPKNRGDIIGKSERTDTDKKRERRKKKENQKKHATENKKKLASISKMNPGLGNKYSKEKAKKLLDQVTKDSNVDKMDESVGSKSVKSSTAFFTELQDQVKSQIQNRAKPKASKAKNIDAKKMKL